MTRLPRPDAATTHVLSRIQSPRLSVRHSSDTEHPVNTGAPRVPKEKGIFSRICPKAAERPGLNTRIRSWIGATPWPVHQPRRLHARATGRRLEYSDECSRRRIPGHGWPRASRIALVGAASVATLRSRCRPGFNRRGTMAALVDSRAARDAGPRGP